MLSFFTNEEMHQYYVLKVFSKCYLLQLSGEFTYSFNAAFYVTK